MQQQIALTLEKKKEHPKVKSQLHPRSKHRERYNFDAFQNEAFQYQMSNANPYPRQIPAFASVANDFEPWTMKDQMLLESLNFGDIAQDIQDTLNASIVEFLQNYNSVDNDSLSHDGRAPDIIKS